MEMLPLVSCKEVLWEKQIDDYSPNTQCQSQPKVKRDNGTCTIPYEKEEPITYYLSWTK